MILRTEIKYKKKAEGASINFNVSTVLESLVSNTQKARGPKWVGDIVLGSGYDICETQQKGNATRTTKVFKMR